jgi:hypothetical protein
MKYAFPIFLITVMASCQAPETRSNASQARIDSLEKKLANTYKPGLGEFMSGIQVHHAKLWFAGENKNWKLADFEIGEIKEALEDIQKYCTDRKEIQSLPMIYPALDSLTHAIQQGEGSSFRRSYNLLTNTCNNCHRATNHEFNVIQTPESPPFTNQDFKPEKIK